MPPAYPAPRHCTFGGFARRRVGSRTAVAGAPCSRVPEDAEVIGVPRADVGPGAWEGRGEGPGAGGGTFQGARTDWRGLGLGPGDASARRAKGSWQRAGGEEAETSSRPN